MSSLAVIAESLSLPCGARRRFIEEIVSAHSDEVWNRVRALHKAVLDEAPGVEAIVSRYIAEGGGWSPPFGTLEAALTGRSQEALQIALAQTALWAHDR